MTGFRDPDDALELRLSGSAAERFADVVAVARRERWAERLHDRDTSLWSSDPALQREVAKWLGWLDAPAHFGREIAALEGFGDGVRDAGFRRAVLMGMGGSSLTAEVLARTFGSEADYLELEILDSTHPSTVAAVVDDANALSTLWIVATKSGTTVESLAFLADAWVRVEAALAREGSDERPGEMVVAITDPGRSVQSLPHHDDLREVFLNPTDIGGRYSALSYTGLVPASLIGLDLDALLTAAGTMLARSREPDPARNPAVGLGLAIGTLARDGRNKLTFVIDPEIASLGAWLEQLLAESTGKQGTGIVPVDLEPLGPLDAYDDDRAFVRVRLAGSRGAREASDGATADERLDELAAAGHPVIEIGLEDPIDLGGEFVRWEVATAIAGAILGINPFDQPNVEEAKHLTRALLAARQASDGKRAAVGERGGDGEHRGDGARGRRAEARADDDRAEDADALPAEPGLIVAEQGLALYGDAALRLTAGDTTFRGELARHLARRKPGAYLAIQAFLAPDPVLDGALARLRALLRDATHCATTAGYGPRYLHSTGQLHKGGPPIGWFLQLTADHRAEREIPGWPYSFGELIDAQARGDFAALEAHDRPVARIHLGSDPRAGLARLEELLTEILSPVRR